MATNRYFTQGRRSEQQMYEDIVIEGIKAYGQDIYYLPRDIVNEDKVLNEDVPSRFNSSYKIEMYIDNIEGFDGEGDLFTKFGVEIRDQATFVVSRRRWDQTVFSYDNEIQSTRPVEGDLIYIPFSKKLFEIMAVEHEQPFYQLKNFPTYKLRCELFEYNDEQLDTGIVEIDDIETQYAYKYLLTLSRDSDDGNYILGERASMTLESGVNVSGEVLKWSDSDGILHLAHVGADDGNFHTFVSGRNIDGLTSRATGVITAVSEDNQISSNEQNEYFDTLVDFLDFSESNPFGDPS